MHKRAAARAVVCDVSGGIRRRELIAGGVGAATAGTLARASEASARNAHARRARRPRVHDVAVVGAGLSGLTAATAVRQAGRSVVVLEARHRVGGRNLDYQLAPGKVAELGGEWAGPGQDQVLALAKELGVGTFDTYSNGSSVYYSGGQRQNYSGDIPPANPASLVELEAAIIEFNNMAASVPAATPWTAPQAAAWDQQTIQTWINQNLHTAEAQNLAELAIRGVYGEEAKEISLLDLLQAISGVGGDFNTLIGSAQSIRFIGGPQQLSKKLAKRLGRAVRLGVAIVAVEQGSHVTLHSSKETFKARRAILTVPKTLFGRIQFTPPLPPAHDQIVQRQPMGSVVKVNAIYSRPFWRDQGLNGQATSEVGPIRITYDNSAPDGIPGVLVGFMEGDDSRAFYGKPPAARRQAALQSFARYFGDEALHPTGYVDQVWAQEPFTRGAYGSFNPPGALTSLEDPMAEPVGSVHYASADASPLWPGYMDGAIRSGQQAAARALAEL
jgi:monoamine oxidase